jgi:hypothetical protein
MQQLRIDIVSVTETKKKSFGSEVIETIWKTLLY